MTAVLPYNAEAERTVLGAVLLDPLGQPRSLELEDQVGPAQRVNAKLALTITHTGGERMAANNPTPGERFWSKVDRSGGPEACWPWRGALNSHGYGHVRWNGKCSRANRVAWMLTSGPLPEDKPCVRHRCDQPSCCNPAHLLPGTHSENMDDMARRGRSASGERNGSHTKPGAVRRGESHSSSRLTAAQVLQIRALAASGTSQEHIASAFGVSRRHVSDVVASRRWKCVA